MNINSDLLTILLHIFEEFIQTEHEQYAEVHIFDDDRYLIDCYHDEIQQTYVMIVYRWELHFPPKEMTQIKMMEVTNG